MLVDERRNKVMVMLACVSHTHALHTHTHAQLIKGMSKHRGRCEASIARVYSEHAVGRDKIVSPDPVSFETGVTGRFKPYRVLNLEIHQLLIEIVTRECATRPIVDKFRVYKRGKIGGKFFTSGEPLSGVRRVREKMFRCGSVFTMVCRGRSVYGRMKRFISYDHINMVEVEWLPIPEYPMGIPVVVRLGFYNNCPVQPPVVLLDDIDPSPVSLLHDHDNNCLYVMRMIGIDTVSE